MKGPKNKPIKSVIVRFNEKRNRKKLKLNWYEIHLIFLKKILESTRQQRFSNSDLPMDLKPITPKRDYSIESKKGKMILFYVWQIMKLIWKCSCHTYYYQKHTGFI